MSRILSAWDKVVEIYCQRTERLARYLDASSSTKLLLLLSVVSLFLILITSQFIEKSGDAVYKWGILRYYIEFGEWYPVHMDHHQGRWGINIPVIALMKMFGTAAPVYYIFPAMCGLAGSILTYMITTKLSSRLAGLAAFLIFAIFPLIARENTQFLPMLPATVFILAALYFILRWLNEQRLLNIIIAGLMVVIAYGCKVTSLYWALAFALFIALYGTNKKTYFSILKMRIGPAVILFSLTIIGGLLIETLLINYCWGLPYGRMQVIAGSHLSNRPNPEYCNFFEWLFSFLRPLSLRGKYFESIPCFSIFILGIISAVLCFMKSNINKKFLSFSFITVYLLHCYVVYKIFPFLHPEKAHSRYFMTVAVCGIILYCASQAEWNRFIWQRFKNIRFVHALKLILCLVWLVPSLIYVANSWLWNGTIINAFVAKSKWTEARNNKLPVLMKLDDRLLNSKLSSADRKKSLRWLTLFGPNELIPKLKDKFFQHVTDYYGGEYILLLNSDELVGTEDLEGLVIEDFDLSIRKQSLRITKTVLSLNHRLEED